MIAFIPKIVFEDAYIIEIWIYFGFCKIRNFYHNCQFDFKLFQRLTIKKLKSYFQVSKFILKNPIIIKEKLQNY